MTVYVAQYPLVASVPLTLGACTTLSVLVFCVISLVLHLKSNTELRMIHRLHGCVRALVVAQTVFTSSAVVVLSVASASSGPVSVTFQSFIARRQAANVLKASGAALVAGYAFFATEHQVFRWLTLVGGAVMAGVDAVDMLDVGQIIGLFEASKSIYKDGDDLSRAFIVRALGVQYAAKVFSFFAWLLVMQMVGCLMHALGWFELNELPEDEEVAGHLKELARATINRRIQEKRTPERFEGGVGKRLFNPTDKMEVMWDRMVDQTVGRDNRMSHPISTNPVGQIPADVQKELCQVLLGMGVKRQQIYEVLSNEGDS